jgi:hypothetical protein
MVTASFIHRLACLGGVCVVVVLGWAVLAYGQAARREAVSPTAEAAPSTEAGAGAQAAPEMEIPESSLRSGLLAADLDAVDKYVTYWADKLTTAGSEQEILDARARLTRGYNRYDNWQFRGAYAERAAKALTAVLDSPDVRKQINAAMAISQMREVAVQPVLEMMVVHHNPALRLYGWLGYRRIRLEVLAQGKDPVGTMLRSLEKAAMTEDCGPVMASVLDMMYLSPDRPSIVSPTVFDGTRTRLFEIFRQCWPRVCQKVLNGHQSMIRAGGAGLDALRRIATDEDATKETQLAAVQMVVDLVWCSAKRYAAGGQTSAQVATNEALLRECETALNAITKLRQIPVNQALGVRDEAKRAAEVEVAVSRWIRLLDNANWPVHEPKFQSAPPTASQPAVEEPET